MTNLLLWPLSRICSVTLQRVILTKKEENKDHRIASHRIPYRFIQSVASSCATKDARYADANRPQSRQDCLLQMRKATKSAQTKGMNARTHASTYSSTWSFFGNRSTHIHENQPQFLRYYPPRRRLATTLSLNLCPQHTYICVRAFPKNQSSTSK